MTLALSRRPHELRLAIFLLTVASLHPLLVWTGRRALDGSDEPLGLVALFVAGVVVHRRRRPPPASVQLAPAAVLLVGYAAAVMFLTPLPGGLLGAAAVACIVSQLYLGRRLDLGLLALLWLSLPLIASLQFYLGFPLRILATEVAAVLLRAGGLPLVVEGAALRLGPDVIGVDAPCSGVKMLWAGGLVISARVAALELSGRWAVLAFASAVIALVLANGIRAAALFYSEAELLPLPDWGHSAVGIVVFGMTAALLLQVSRYLAERQRCVA